MIWLFKLPKNHYQVFGNEKPVSIPFMMRSLFNFWTDSSILNILHLTPLTHNKEMGVGVNAEFTNVWWQITQEQRDNFWKEYIEEYNINDFSDPIPIHSINREPEFWDGVTNKTLAPMVIADETNCPHKYRVIEGHHRKAVAKYTGLKTYPAFRIIPSGNDKETNSQGLLGAITRHEYTQIMKRAARLKIDELIDSGRGLYQPVIGFDKSAPHGGLKNRERIDIILTATTGSNKYLDIGSNIGYVSFELVKEGKEVVAVDKNKDHIDFCNILSKYYEMYYTNPLFIHSEILEFLRTNTIKFDSILMLMVFHHLLRPDKVMKNNAHEILNLIAESSEQLILQCRDIPSMELIGDQIPEYIINNTVYNYWETVAICPAMKLPIWKFRK